MADAAGDIDMAPLEELIEIRGEQAHIREFQGKANEQKTNVDPVVFQRVQDDYNKRHAALETRAAPLKVRARQEYQKLKAKRDKTHGTHEDARLAKQELEFRRTVGELTDSELAERLAEPEQTLSSTSEELAALDTLKARFLEGFGTEAELELPPPPAPKPAPKAAPSPITTAPPPLAPKIAETERISGRPDIPPTPSAYAGVGISSSSPVAAAVAPTEPISDPHVSHTLSGISRASLAPPPAPAPAPVAPPPPPPSEPIGATRIVTMDEMGGTSIQTGFFSAPGESPATMMVPVAVLVGPQNGDASGAVAMPHRLGSSTYIGRSEESHIRVQRPSVSRQHALVSAGPTGFMIQDLHSQNGTYINGERITEQASLQDGDKVTLGDAEFVFQFLKSDLAG
jgi:hypothetical protein